MEAKIRKRRPAFDREEGVAIAQGLFHERGYDAVSVADLCDALGIVAPSLYAAYGSKAELFNRAMGRYVENDFLPLDDILAPDSNPTEALTELFVRATEHYTRHDKWKGCMVTEGMRADDETARTMAAEHAKVGSDLIGTYIRDHHAIDPERVTDYVLMTLRGLSSYACLGYSTERLTHCAEMAGRALEGDFDTHAA
ncbi:TetR/AcrR family transcriptional regulator [Agrobacterium sp. Ap1]|uniref:TetR/AcrR family transcriptional regulator n=1 Tax=Agrobacterium sp. Ap1 TaxID=2815337 RepID=UPI001A8C089C|nr:TetR/AcrR family transcriptional regulator [Agrobacterium sp. Ap1]MBO0143331.1 TetR/AcrR family transcriptional regulator [Agrobacterium sp. Ap1]